MNQSITCLAISDNGRRKTSTRRATTSSVDHKRTQIHDGAQQLRLGRGRVTDHQHVEVTATRNDGQSEMSRTEQYEISLELPSNMTTIVKVLLDATDKYQNDSLLDQTERDKGTLSGGEFKGDTSRK
jgi:hypothetical protein